MRSGCKEREGEHTLKVGPVHPAPLSDPAGPTHSHVGGTASTPRFGLRVNKAATDAKVTELDLAPLI